MSHLLEENFCFQPRIIRSPRADCWGDELATALKAYSSDYLESISNQGFDGIWVHVQLRHTVRTNLFPTPSPRNLFLLNKIIEKATRHKIKVFVYLLEPRGPRANDPIWTRYPEIKGQPFSLKNVHATFDGTYFALCTSTAAVKEYLVEGSCSLFRQAPGLAGAFLINASEGHTHCYSHFCKYKQQTSLGLDDGWKKVRFTCPRCANRDPVEVTAEVIRLLHQGIRSASSLAEVIVWTWSWSLIEPDPQPRLIAALPSDVVLMSDWERGGWKKVAGKKFLVDEYSLSTIGPSLRFRHQHRLGKQRGLRTMAKIQIGSTHEIVSVPYLPVPFNLAEKFRRMKKMGVNGYLGCWIFGGDISPMSHLAGLMSRRPQPSVNQAVRKVASVYFGRKASRAVVTAWKYFSQAWKEYPFSIPFLYYGPINYATAYPLSLKLREAPPISSWLPLPRDRNQHLRVGDSLDAWLKPFTVAEMSEALRVLLKKWEKGCKVLQTASQKMPDNQPLALELGLAKHIMFSVRSTANIVLFFHLLRALRQEQNKKKKADLFRRLSAILTEELAITSQDKKLVTSDTRLGYHPEAYTHLFTLKDLEYRIKLLKKEIGKINSFRQKYPVKKLKTNSLASSFSE
ncbi:MAG: hypothetical protein NC911_08285 [Candidatus Omnitrophica bacterium]|nr:hypothetical protein [Candidatus Omnitrophota bacterium]